MAIFKCKMCGGTIEIQQGESVGVCEYCGTKQTLPNTNDDVIANLYNRANNLRLKSEFDRAQKVYEDIVNKDDSQAEAHWGIVLCKYGIEYVTDPETGKKIPTCHRTSYEAIRTDADYLAAIDYADTAQQAIYEAEAREIDKIQKGILAIAKEEKPFDVFICYKETDETGNRTVDSTIANDIYYQLTQEGFKVFYAAITLEDKLGQEYEPYIFAALNSAKMMLVIGTKPEYFNAVWVKNEWSRYLKLIKNDRSRLLIPCYRDMDAYDLPEEFAHLQAQDMAKIGFINDVVRGIKKVLVSGNEPKVKETVVVNTGAGASVAPLLKRVFMFLEDGDWDSADEYCEKVLDLDPENAEAYLGKLMAELRVCKEAYLGGCEQSFDDNSNYQKAVRFGDAGFTDRLNGYISRINARNKEKHLNVWYNVAVEKMRQADNEYYYKRAYEAFEKIGDYKDSKELAQQCLEQAEICRKDAVYYTGISQMNKTTVNDVEQAIKTFKSIFDWKDADDKISECERKIEELIVEEEKRDKKVDEIAGVIYKKHCSDLGLEEKLAAAQSDVLEMQEIMNSFDELSIELDELKRFLLSSKEKIKDLETKRDSLGLFNIKEKKLINQEIEDLNLQLTSSDKRYEQLKSIFKRYRSKAEVQQNLQRLERDVFELKDRIQRYLQLYSDDLSYIEAIELYNNDKLIRDKINTKYPELNQLKIRNLDFEAIYYQACQALSNRKSRNDVEWAKQEFESIIEYKDSRTQAKKCGELLGK